MKFIADLHVHSPFSRATSKTSNLAGLAAWARIKGIHVLGTGDFTHPGWFRQLSELLAPAEPGLHILKMDAAPAVAKILASVHLDKKNIIEEAAKCRFVLSAEISSIYKRHGKVRKIHNILYVPDLESAARINSRLAAVGNIESDGRPILGLDSRDLLEILLEQAPEGFLVPAHIWTPWFSLFGSKSGFDSIEECFGDLTSHIFALETGLSSDPDMNRLISALDSYTLISNSDCHSPAKLGREANLFDTDFSFYSMRNALKKPADGFLGTIEFYPEEGKYHFDGHRKCKICYDPDETRKHKGICPVCGRTLTVGVTHRVMELADRAKPVYPTGAPLFHSLIPLPEVLGEILDLGPATKGVMAQYSKIISLFESEFNLLLHTPIQEISQRYSPLLAEAVQRIRTGKVIRIPGFDGEFGVIKVFAEGERAELAGQIGLFAGSRPDRKRKTRQPSNPGNLFEKKDSPVHDMSTIPKELTPEQTTAVATNERHCIITAGPGTGKTYTLVSRLVRLLQQGDVAPGSMVAITFTNRAANEVRERLAKEVGEKAAEVFIGTFHGFCLHWLRVKKPELVVAGEETRMIVIKNLFPELTPLEQRRLSKEISLYINSLATGTDIPPELPVQQDKIVLYLRELESHDTIDLDAVIPIFNRRLLEEQVFRYSVVHAINSLFIDEFQDLNHAQYQLVALLAQTSRVFAIGDPDQAIYGFRGSRPEFFFKFIKAFNAHTLFLTRNYRSAPAILAAAGAVIRHNPLPDRKALVPHRSVATAIELYWAVTPQEEAEFIVRRIEEAIGGISHFSINTGRSGNDAGREGSMSFGDIAVLYRLSQQAVPISQALERRGIPFQLVDMEPFYMRPQLRAAYYWLQVAVGTGDHAEHVALLRHIKGIGDSVVRQLEQTILIGDRDFFLCIKDLDLSPKAGGIVNELQVLIGLFENKVAHAGLATALKEAMQWLQIDLGQADAARLLELAGAFGKDLHGFSSYLKNNAAATVYDERAEAVALMTMHAAKGLEFPMVFMSGVEEGLLPCSLPGFREADAGNVKEERRLFYVGMTRARDKLILSGSATRSIFGESHNQKMSRFIKEIPQQMIKHADRRLPKKKKQKAVQMKLFD